MSTFLCAVSTDGTDPIAFALVEQTGAGAERTYLVRDLGRLDGEDPVARLQDTLASAPEYAGQTSLITMGGQRVADLFHEGGLSAVAVQTEPPASRDTDTIAVPEQQLVDTFSALYRHRVVEVPRTVDGVSEALAALYGAMSDDAGAQEASEEMEALAESEATGEDVQPPPVDGPNPAVVEQSGSAENVSTAQIGAATGGDRSTKDAPFFVADDVSPSRHGRAEEGAKAFDPVRLGEHRGPALALGLAVWYGEYSTTDLPMTDQADETPRARQIRRARQEAARQRQGQR